MSHNQVENACFSRDAWGTGHGMSGHEFDQRFGGRGCVCFPILFAGGTANRSSIHEAGRSARSVASVMHPVAPGIYDGASLAQINRKSFQYGTADPNARWIRRVDTVTRTGIWNRHLRSVDGRLRRAAWRIPEGSRAGASSCNEGHGPVRSSGAGVR